jgi:hypothetical protein
MSVYTNIGIWIGSIGGDIDGEFWEIRVGRQYPYRQMEPYCDCCTHSTGVEIMQDTFASIM